MFQRVLRRGVSACALILAIAPPTAQAQQSLPTIEVGARTRGTGAQTGKPRTDGGGSPPATTAQAPKSYWQTVDEKKKIPEGSYAAPYASSGTKTDTPIMDTPVNVQVVTPQELKDRQVTTLPDAVKYVSGVTISPNATNGNRGSGNRFGAIQIRGFEAGTTFRNGFRTGAASDFGNIESVEVLKGSAATLYGLVEPGGIINLITKQPSETAAYSAQQQIGSYAQYRTSIGATGPLTKDKSVLYRLDAVYENNHDVQDFVKDRKIFVAPVVRWNISPDTQINAEFQYSKSANGVPFGFAPAYNGYLVEGPSSWSLRKRNYGNDAAFNNENFLFGLNWRHDFNNNWQIRQQVQYSINRGNLGNWVLPLFTDNTIFGLPSDPPLVWRWGPVLHTNETRQLSAETNLVGHFSTGVLEHTLLIGADHSYVRDWGSEVLKDDWSGVDFFRPINPGVVVPGGVVSNGANVNSVYYAGAEIHDQIKLPFGLHLMGGVRYQNYAATVRTFDALDPTIPSAWDPANKAQRVTPRVGVLWRPQEWFSLYANYAEGFGPNIGARIYPNQLPQPSDARQYEFGTKTEFFGGKLRSTAAYFNVSRTNVLRADLAHPGFVLATGEVNSRGFEFDLQGEIAPNWNVTLAYANTEATVTKDDDKTRIGDRFFFVPRNTASLFTTYALRDGWAKGLTFGGGATYTDAVRMDYFGEKLQIDLPPYALVSLMSSYSFNLGPTKVTAQLNVENLLNHDYFSSGINSARPGTPQGWTIEYRTFGPPRMVRGALSVSF